MISVDCKQEERSSQCEMSPNETKKTE